MPPIFVDAAPTAHHTFIISTYRPHSHATSITAPGWIYSQQDAELYAVFHAIRQASLRHMSYLCIMTDNFSVFHTITSCRVSCTASSRARILRQILRTCLASGIRLQTVRIPSQLNPADAFSRPSRIDTRPSLATHPFFLITHTSYAYTGATPALWYR